MVELKAEHQSKISKSKMGPTGGILMNGSVFQGPYCVYDISQTIAVNVASDFVRKLLGTAGYCFFLEAARSLARVSTTFLIRIETHLRFAVIFE